jgi:cytochrome P450
MLSVVTPETAPGLRQRFPLPYGPMARSRRDPLGFLLDGLRRYGDVFRYQLGPLVFHWYPFLGGPHQCIGQEFALMEATLVVAMLVQSFRLRLAPGARVEPRPMLSLRPRDGLPMTIHLA